MKMVTLGIRWSELFGEHKGDMSDKMRRSRWETWKQLSRDHGRFESIAWWSTPEELCFNCEYERKRLRKGQKSMLEKCGVVGRENTAVT